MSVSNRQQEERLLRQERILDGALEVFKEKGFDGATMDSIALESGFGKATLYYYFHSKEEVFSAILENGWMNLWSSLEPIIDLSQSPREKFISVLIKIAENVRARPGLYEFLFTAPKAITFEEEPWKKYQERMYSIIFTLLEDGVKSKEFPQIDPKILFKAMGGLFMGLVLMGNKEKAVSVSDIEDLLNQSFPDQNK